MLGDFTFDLKLARARDEINEALGQRMPNLGFAPSQQPMQTPGNPQLTPQMSQMPAPMGQMPVPMGQFPMQVGQMPMQMGPIPVQMGQMQPQMGQAQPMQPQSGQMPMQMGQTQAQITQMQQQMGQMQPQTGQMQPNMPARQSFQEGGLATSVRNDPVYHDRDIDFLNTRNQRMRELVGKQPYAEGGAVRHKYAAGGDIVVTGRRVFDPLFNFMEPTVMSGGGGGREGVFPTTRLGGAGGYSGDYDIGALQNAIRQASKQAPKAPVQAPQPVSGPSAAPILDIGRVGGVMKPSYGGGQADVMRIMDLDRSVGRTAKGVGARLGIGFAEGGGAWTRKEGKNPEGGLNAVGRASLRAQGHDIKPPVSAKQAKKSPKAAARRKSFCARMSGMPGPMKDEKGRPTRKALSLRKWDC